MACILVNREAVQSEMINAVTKRNMEHHITMIYKAVEYLMSDSQVIKAALLAGKHIAGVRCTISADAGGVTLAKCMERLIIDGEYKVAQQLVLELCDMCSMPPPHRAIVTNPL